MCCPQSNVESEDTRLRAILERLDDMESRMTTMSPLSIASHRPKHLRDEIPGPFMVESSKNEPSPFSRHTAIFEGAGEVIGV